MHWRHASRRASAVAGFYAPVTTSPLHARRHIRRDCHAIGFISFHDKDTAVLMKDISAGGARISFATDQDVPDDIYLRVPSENVVRPCRVVWRKGREVGLCFKD